MNPIRQIYSPLKFGMATHRISAQDTDDHYYPFLALERYAHVHKLYCHSRRKIRKDPQTGRSYTGIKMIIETPKLPSGRLSETDRFIIDTSCPRGHKARRGHNPLVSHQVEMIKPGLLAWLIGPKTRKVHELTPKDYEPSQAKSRQQSA